MSSYCYDYVNPKMLSQTEQDCSARRFCEKDLSATIYKEATILPIKPDYDINGCLAGGVVTAAGTFVENSAFSISKGYAYSFLQVEQSEDVVIYMGSLLNIYGHTFTDNLKKLWYLKTLEAIRLLEHGAKVVYVTTGNQELKEYTIKFFEFAGFSPKSWTHITAITRCKTCIIPDDSFGCEDIAVGGFYTLEYKAIISDIKNAIVEKNVNISYPEKIYFTRTGIPNNRWREIGEERIEKVFRDKGFTIISPEELSVEEQLRYLISCKEFASTEGSISHSSVFCQEGTAVYIIRKVDQINHYQLVMNEVAGLNVTYIDAHKSIQANPRIKNYGPFFLYFTPELKRFYGRFIITLPLALRPSWWWYNLRNRRIIKQFFSL